VEVLQGFTSSALLVLTGIGLFCRCGCEGRARNIFLFAFQKSRGFPTRRLTFEQFALCFEVVGSGFPCAPVRVRREKLKMFFRSAVLLARAVPRFPLPRGSFSLPIYRSFSSVEHTLHHVRCLPLLPLFFCPPLTSILAVDPCPSSLLLVETHSHAQKAKSATMATSASSADDMVALSPRRVWH
jgi:hypothetical protein